MMGTRIIINEGDEFKEVILKNEDKKAELVQVWVDNGKADIKSIDDEILLIPTPSVFKIEPNSIQSIRINVLNPSLKKDEESIYWFNFLQIFPKSEKTKQRIELSLITAVKIFYRPSKINEKNEDTSIYLKATHVPKSEYLIVKNTSPYHINLSGKLYYSREKDCYFNVDGNVIKPFSEMKKKGNIKKCHPNSISLEMIEDDGRVNKITIPIT